MPDSPVKIAVFDLNQTVYQRSSKEEFFKYICYKRNYKLLNIFQLTAYKLLGKLRLLNQTQFKENFFSYLDGLPPDKVYEYAREFWHIEFDKHFNQALLRRIDQLKQEGIKIYFISGALDVYIKPLFDIHLPVDQWMSTQSEYRHGQYQLKGKACKDTEKTRRLLAEFEGREFRLVETYSDEKEDLFTLTDSAYLVKEGKIIPSNDN